MSAQKQTPHLASEQPCLLTVEKLSVSLRGSGDEPQIVSDMSFSLNRSETLCIVGESGCGKSVTAQAVMRLLDPIETRIQAQTLSLNGRALMSLSEREMRKVRGAEIAMIFQDPMTSLNPLKRVGAQIVQGLRHHSNVSRSEAYEQAEQMLARVQIPDPRRVMRQYPFELSGGMRQRVMIASSLAMGPSVLLADEPTTALDTTVQTQVLGLLAELRDKLGLGIVLITHDFGVVAEVADRVAVMYAGRLVEMARVQDLFDAPRHPYSQGLMGALPDSASGRSDRLNEIPGVVPAPGQIGAGCPFASRCSFAQPECLQSAPELRSLTPHHKVACHVDM